MTKGLVGSGGGIRTPDTRIMMPGLYPTNQQLEPPTPVKPASENQKLSGILSNRPAAVERLKLGDNSVGASLYSEGVRQPNLVAPAGVAPSVLPCPLAHPSNRLIAHLNGSWRVVDDPLQWILQRRKGKPRKKNSGWRDRCFCRTRGGLLRSVRELCGEVDDEALAHLHALPEFHSDWESPR